jgi:multiple sugar transport system permease protein
MTTQMDEVREKRTLGEVITSEKYYRWLLIGPLLLTLAVFMLYPFFHCLYYSTQRYVPGQPDVFIGLDNFRYVLADAEFWKALGINLQVIVACIIIELVLGLAIALLWYREFRGQNLIRAFCLLPLLVSPLVMSMIWAFIFQYDIGPINQLLLRAGLQQANWLTPKWALFSISLITSWQWLPFSIFILFAGLRGLPRDVFEAAKVDGASPWYMFRRITLPSLMPLVLIIVLLRTMWLIRLFDPLYGTTRGGSGTQSLDWVVFRTSFAYFDMGVGSTMALISLFLTIILCAILFRYLMKALGAIK